MINGADTLSPGPSYLVCVVTHMAIIITHHTLLMLYLGSFWQTGHYPFLALSPRSINVFVFSSGKPSFSKWRKQIFQLKNNNQIRCLHFCSQKLRSNSVIADAKMTGCWRLFGKLKPGRFYSSFYLKHWLKHLLPYPPTLQLYFIHFVLLKGQLWAKTLLVQQAFIDIQTLVK